jgi:ATP-dependent DNA helicase RecG
MKKSTANRYSLFISSVQKELAEERRAVKDFIMHDSLLSRFISDVFLFEDIPAADRKPDDIYLGEVGQRDIYLAIFGNEYGWKNEEGKSPTELEFEHATKTHRERLVFIKGNDDKARKLEMAELVARTGRQVTRRRFSDTPELIREVYASLVECLENRGALRTTPFDNSVCTEYQTLLGVAKRTAHRDLTELVERGILEKVGTTGRGTAYVLRKGAIKGPNGPSVSSGAKGATKGPKGS